MKTELFSRKRLYRWRNPWLKFRNDGVTTGDLWHGSSSLFNLHCYWFLSGEELRWSAVTAAPPPHTPELTSNHVTDEKKRWRIEVLLSGRKKIMDKIKFLWG